MMTERYIPILTCSAREYVESKGKKLSDYELETVYSDHSLANTQDIGNFYFEIRKRNLEAVVDLRSLIGGRVWGTGLLPKKTPIKRKR